MPEEIEYDIATFANFIKKDENAIIAFYGGEPLLYPDIIKSFIHSLPAKKLYLGQDF